MDPVVQISEVSVKVCLVVLPGQPVHSRRGVPLKIKERHADQVEADVMEERGEPFLLPVPCGLPYAVQRLGHAFPVLRPARALLSPGGTLRPPAPRSPPLAPPTPRPVARLCSSASQLLWQGLTSPVRTSSASAPHLPDADPGRTPGRAGDLPVPGQGASVHAGVSDHAGPAEARADAPARMAFRYSNNVGTRDCRPFAAQWPACTLPCRRFAGTLAGADARLGAGVDRYSFTVMDFHHLLLAGLPAHYCRRIIWAKYCCCSGGRNAHQNSHVDYTCPKICLRKMEI